MAVYFPIDGNNNNVLYLRGLLGKLSERKHAEHLVQSLALTKRSVNHQDGDDVRRWYHTPGINRL